MMEVSPLHVVIVIVDVVLVVFFHPRTRIASRRLERQLRRHTLEWNMVNVNEESRNPKKKSLKTVEEWSESGQKKVGHRLG